jgi:hypothetical protein
MTVIAKMAAGISLGFITFFVGELIGKEIKYVPELAAGCSKKFSITALSTCNCCKLPVLDIE